MYDNIYKYPMYYYKVMYITHNYSSPISHIGNRRIE